MAKRTDPTQCDTQHFWKPVGVAETGFNYTNWHPSVPSGAVISSAPPNKYGWGDLRCDVKLCSICDF